MYRLIVGSGRRPSDIGLLCTLEESRCSDPRSLYRPAYAISICSLAGCKLFVQSVHSLNLGEKDTVRRNIVDLVRHSYLAFDNILPLCALSPD